MKRKSPKTQPTAKPANGKRSFSNVISSVLRTSSRNSAYAFAATLGIWLPKAQAATLINLDAFTHPLGELNTWTNTGSATGDFVTGAGATSNPTNVVTDGVKGISFQPDGGTAGAGSHFVGPTAPNSVCFNGSRTVEAWVFNTGSLAEETVFAWGRRGIDGLNNGLGHGSDLVFGAVTGFGADADISWGTTPAQVATNRLLGQWTYIVQSFNGTINSVYVNGRLANSEGPPATTLINTTNLDETATISLPFRVARQNAANGGVSGAGDGNLIIGRVRVHDVAMDSLSISNQFFIEKGAFNLNDTDSDGMPDWWEVRYGLNVNSAADASGDADSDGLTNLQEFQKGTVPTDSDTDDDALLDGVETGTGVFVNAGNAGTSPLVADTDSDGLLDGAEVTTHLTDPNKGDTDGDILSDGAEVGCGSNPLNAGSICGLLNRAIDLDATGLPAALLTNWLNSGFIAGTFSVPTNATVPSVVTRDGVKGVGLQATPANAAGTHYFGPATTAEVTGSSPRTIEAWVYDETPIQAEKIIIAWGSRNNGNGTDYPFGMGTDNTFGACASWGEPDIGWADQEVHGRWTHVAVTWDGTTHRIYSDAVLANSEALPTPGGQTLNTTLNAPTDGLPFRFRIGRQNSNTTFDSIDNTGAGAITIAKVRVYTNSLDGATIRARFDSEKGAFGLTDPDGDGLPSWYEIRCNMNPIDATGTNGPAGNQDNDGLTNLQEFQIGTLANVADTDADGSNDGAEVNRVDAGLPAPPSGANAPTNPLLADTDGDGLRDGVETDTGIFVSPNNTGTDPLVIDTDGDTHPDGVEVSQSSNPVNALSVPDPGPRINLISTNLPLGLLTSWTNNGSFSNGMAFTAVNNGGIVQVVQGVTALRLPGAGGTAPYYNGPTNPAAANLTGDPVYSMEAWVHNESIVGEETIMSWGRRDLNGACNAFNHGNSLDFGAMTHFGARDLGWGGAVNANSANRWTYLVYTYDALSSIQRAYVDGVQVNQETIADLLIAVAGTATNAPMRIGAQNNADGTASGTGRANGLSIAEMRVYTRVLTPAEISSSFTAGGALYGLFDTDNDTIPSWWERRYPGCMNENVTADGTADCDSDGLDNAGEYANGTDPLDSDSDDDGLTDGQEVNTYGTNPTNPDTDYDGLRDNREIALGTAPAGLGSQDSDADTFSDSTEVVYGSNPASAGSTPVTTTPLPFVTLDATALPPGPLVTWSNLNALQWQFVAPTNAVPEVQVVDGTKAVRFFATNHYAGPNEPNFFAGNASRTVEAWIWNPAPRVAEETVFAWGRRGGGPDGSNSSFQTGTDAAFGAMGLWGGGPDVPWGTNATEIVQNTPTNAWTFVAYTYNNADSNKVVYVNGVRANSETNATVLNTHFFDPTDPRNSGNPQIGRGLPFRVGAQSDAGGNFDAGAARPNLAIAKIRAYDVAKSAQQIADQYNAERIQFPGQPVIRNVRVQTGTGFIVFDWTPAVGHTYAVERKNEVTDGWSTIATGQVSGSFTNDPAGTPRFYRLRIE